MFKRQDAATRSRLRKEYLANQLFCDMYPSLRQVKGDLTPTEIWSEALRIVEDFARSSRPELEVDEIKEELELHYSTFLDDSEVGIKRDRLQIQTSVFLILFTAFYIVACAGTSIECHPHHDLCVALAKATYSHPLREKLWKSVRQTEDEEEMAGRRIETFDMMLQDVTEEAADNVKNETKREFVSGCVDEIIKMQNAEAFTQAERVLSRINDRDGHLYDAELARLRMGADNLSKALTVGGDLVMGNKHVGSEVQSVAAGGIGINITNDKQ
jgi:hypothetical protein